MAVVLLQLSRCVFARDLLPLPVLDPFQADIARVHAAAFRHGIIRPDGAEASVSHCSHSLWQFPFNCSNRSRTRLRPHPSSQVTLPQLHWRKPHPAWRQHQLHRHRKKCSTEVVETTTRTTAAGHTPQVHSVSRPGESPRTFHEAWGSPDPPRSPQPVEAVDAAASTVDDAALGQRRQERLLQLPDLGRTRSYYIQRSGHN